MENVKLIQFFFRTVIWQTDIKYGVFFLMNKYICYDMNKFIVLKSMNVICLLNNTISVFTFSFFLSAVDVFIYKFSWCAAHT